MKDADRRSSKTSFKRLEKMTESQKAAAIREFDREFIAETFSAPGPRQRDLWRRAKSKKPIGRPRRGKGCQVISLSIERSLLKEADAFARRSGISRAALVERGLKRELATKSKVA